MNDTITDELYLQTLHQAVSIYFRRQSRRARPKGKYDNFKRWHPADEERRGCCFSIRKPTMCWPRTLLQHCRTMLHVANLCGVSYDDLIDAVREQRKRMTADATWMVQNE